VLVDSESDDHGILGMDHSIPAGPLSVRVQVRIGGEADGEESLGQIVDWAVEHCPVTDAIRRAVQVIAEVEVG
jgi:organic hydroperoxide reductase OsmC/OhrA